jgi:hypothetical protein
MCYDRLEKDWNELKIISAISASFFSPLEIYDTYEIEVKNTFGFEQSSVILSCEISPPSASSYVHIIGWLEKINDQIIQLDLRKFIKQKKTQKKSLLKFI